MHEPCGERGHRRVIFQRTLIAEVKEAVLGALGLDTNTQGLFYNTLALLYYSALNLTTIQKTTLIPTGEVGNLYKSNPLLRTGGPNKKVTRSSFTVGLLKTR